MTTQTPRRPFIDFKETTKRNRGLKTVFAQNYES